MPPEPLTPWERRDFRKHDGRLGGGYGGGAPPRWREQHHLHPQNLRSHPYHQQQRWYSDFRFRPPTPGHGKQGSYHMYSEEYHHAVLQYGSRVSDRNIDDGNIRPFESRGEERYFRNSRDNRSSGSLKRKSNPSEPAISSSVLSRPTNYMNKPKSEDRPSNFVIRPMSEDRPSNFVNRPKSEDRPTPTSDVNKQKFEDRPTNDFNKPKSEDRPANDFNKLKSEEILQVSGSTNSNNSLPHSDHVNSVDQPPFLMKDQHDKNSRNVDRSSDMFQNLEKQNSLASIDWKPLKRTRTGSLSSRGSGSSHSSSSKFMGTDSTDSVVEVQPKNVMSVQSPGVSVACVSSSDPALSEENNLKKKPRLGWGEGLAKYEKKKVDIPEDVATVHGSVVSVNNAEVLQSHSMNLVDRSPGAACLSDSGSPATSSSVACSFSPGIEEKQSIKAASIDHDSTDLNHSPRIASQSLAGVPAFSLENLEPKSIANLCSSIDDLLQSYNQSSVDTGFMQTTGENKLSVWKFDLLKSVEMTEIEIDSLENEMKSLISELGHGCPCLTSSSSFPEECNSEPHRDQVTASSADIIVENRANVLEHGNAELKDEDMEIEDEAAELKDENKGSPDGATSKFVGVPFFVEDVSPAETVEHTEGFMNSDANNSRNLELKCSDNGRKYEKLAGHADDSGPICPTLSGGCNFDYDREEHIGLIYASNKDFANGASEELNMLPTNQSFDISNASSISCMQSDPMMVEKKFLMRKQFLQFQEEFITLKYKLLEHMWKKDLFVSARKTPHKSHRKLHRRRCHSSSRSRSSLPVENLCFVPTEEVINLAQELLSHFQAKIYRNSLKMPALILDKEEKKASRLISTSGLVEDPCVVEKERSLINPWTSEERKIFMDKLASCGKDFRKIASFLDHKTTAECVEFYYKNHKSECFEKPPKKPDKPHFMKQRKPQPKSTYLVTSRKRWNPEVNTASLDILGSASAIAAKADYGLEIQQKCSSTGSKEQPRENDGSLERPYSVDIYHDERETLAADALASICGSLSSEAMSSCITTSVDVGERVGSTTKCSFTPEVTQNVVVDDEDADGGDDDGGSSDESCCEMDPTAWTDEEKACFIQAVSSYGKDFAMVSRCVRSRTRNQCKVFYSKARKILGLDFILPGHCAVRNNVNGGGSDSDDGCVVETGSVNCIEPFRCKKEDEDGFPSTDVKSIHESSTIGPLTRDIKPEVGNPMPALDINADVSGQNGANSGQNGSKVEVAPIVEEAGDSGLPNGLNEKDHTGQELFLCNESLHTVDVKEAHSTTQSDMLSGSEKKPDLVTSHVNSLQQKGHVVSVETRQIVGTGKQHQNLSGHSLSDHVKSLRGYPASVSTLKEINGEKIDHKSHTISNSNGNFLDYSLQNCNLSRQQSPTAKSLFPSQEQVEKPPQCHRNGDVKLFGKILTTTSEKPNSSIQDNKTHHHHKETNILKHNGDQRLKLDPHSPSGLKNYPGSENIPIMNFGLWDGQTGLPLPDSALLMAKYPSAFSNYAMSTANYELLSRRRQVQPFSMDMKQQQDVMLQRRNGFDVFVSPGMVGSTSVIGGQWTGVSDPVAAIKMHYEQFGRFRDDRRFLKED